MNYERQPAGVAGVHRPIALNDHGLCVMNVPSPEWGSFLPTRQPLTSGLRAAFRSDQRLPAEFQNLLNRLGRKSGRRVADKA